MFFSVEKHYHLLITRGSDTSFNYSVTWLDGNNELVEQCQRFHFHQLLWSVYFKLVATVASIAARALFVITYLASYDCVGSICPPGCFNYCNESRLNGSLYMIGKQYCYTAMLELSFNCIFTCDLAAPLLCSK